MRWVHRIAGVAIVSVCLAAAGGVVWADDATAEQDKTADAKSGGEVKTGIFQTTFTDRSPLSEMKALTRRLKALKAGDKAENHADYDLAKEHFWVYVPEKYDPAKPMGLIALALYKGADSLPPAILPELDEANVALVVPKEFLDTWWKRAGLMLDAAYNMQKLYKIDPKRVYVFGGPDWADADGQRYHVGPCLGLFYPEVFTGIFMLDLPLYRPARASNGGMYPADIGKLEPAQLQLATTHPMVINSEQDAEHLKAASAAYKADGFKYGKLRTVSTEQYHYPNFAKGWIPEVLKYLDGVTADLKLPGEGGAATKAAK